MNLLKWILIVINIPAALTAAVHALLYKRNPQSAWGWIGVCLFVPIAGPLFYFLFGINRIRTRARKLEQKSPFRIRIGYERADDDDESPSLSVLTVPEFSEIAQISETVTRRPLSDGNLIEPLQNGEAAYPAMIAAIENAKRTLYLSSYIFNTDNTGKQFINALGRAAKRGIDVKVLVDGVGEMYSTPRARTLLKKRGVHVARFLPPRLIPPMLYINLRNHRKILVSDGHTGFVGGMNISDRHMAENQENPERVNDLHFRLQGPVVSQIEHVFLEDWRFTTGEKTLPSASAEEVDGGAICRTIVDGPNEDLDKLASILLGAIAAARRRILIMSPYFLPSREMIAALQTAALRGLEIAVVLPEKNNLPFVQWATSNMLWEILQKGIRVYYQPPPFVHTKLFIVDNYYVQIGSANIDPRSLRLNFELVVEIYHQPTAALLTSHIIETIKRSREVSLKEIDARPLTVRTRDAIAWLLSPYL
ncbi:MAG: cardiolipin synthase [Desulfobacteraceae bacterium]|jgi:cardiolipin synthase A/B|nr:cardiolipin synthase [Desulfobacteraceae bacterium]MDH3572409.1 cardiolipin synthase [Desulfobacteraceae bacterium]MDH3721468.1 cardiolipin synthase [Desulfobacteraceae bacterium]MDH3835380.1 cardiolipin synthase [Desulfobacteraceae bacterium]MDH3874841.1 cardiolipin synthase [Desulfobacteraceae bacterium]